MKAVAEEYVFSKHHVCRLLLGFALGGWHYPRLLKSKLTSARLCLPDSRPFGQKLLYRGALGSQLHASLHLACVLQLAPSSRSDVSSQESSSLSDLMALLGGVGARHAVTLGRQGLS